MAWEYPPGEIAANADRLLRHGNVPYTCFLGQIIPHAVVQGPFTAPGQVCVTQLWNGAERLRSPHHDRAAATPVAET